MAHLYVPYSACLQKVVSLYLFNDCPFPTSHKTSLLEESWLIAPLPISSRPQTQTTAHLVAEVYWKLPSLLMQSVYLITWQGWPECNTRQLLLEQWLLVIGRWGFYLQDLAADWTFTSADLQWVRSIWEYWLVLSTMKKQKNLSTLDAYW